MRNAAAALAATLAMIPAVALSQIVPPKPGVEPPQVYKDRVAKDKSAFKFQKAWIGKARRAKKARQAFFSERRHRGLSPSMIPADARREIAVSGRLAVPVIMIKFATSTDPNPPDPYPTSDLQAKLFDGPNPTGTMTELYNEMSYGKLTMTGTVYPASGGWVQASDVDTYYEGGTNGLCPPAKTGQLILEALQAVDGTLDFGTYDNDGPDGNPNSGDDDGFVDFVAIVQPETGAECGTNNMQSHRWVVGGWPEFGATYAGNCQVQAIGNPWSTNDASTNGGFVKVWDYTLLPGKGAVNGCGNGVLPCSKSPLTQRWNLDS